MSDRETKRQAKENRFELVGEFVRIFARNGRWYASYQLDGKQYRSSLQTCSKKEAQRRALRLEDDIVAGRKTRPTKPPTVESVACDYIQYLKSNGRAAKTLVKYRKIMERVRELADRRKARTILDINLQFADAYCSERVQADIAQRTIDDEKVVIRQLVNFALRRKLIAEDPLEGLELKKTKPTPQPCWSPAETETILAASEKPQQYVFQLLADTGMRIGEVIFLTWGDVDFERGVLHIRPKDGWKPKTGDIRSVPMTNRVMAMLTALPRKGRWVFTAARTKAHPEPDRQISERRTLVSLKRVLKKLGIKGHLHTFRHSFISKALAQMIPDTVVREWVGHVDPRILKMYTHVRDEASRAAMRKFEAGPKETAKESETKKDASSEGGSDIAQK
jgi:integrase